MKKIIILLSTFVMLSAAMPAVGVNADMPAKNENLGDVNLDGTINPLDASAALALYAREATGGGKVTDEERLIADVNHDTRVDPLDSSKILEFYALKAIGVESMAGEELTMEHYSYLLITPKPEYMKEYAESTKWKYKTERQ